MMKKAVTIALATLLAAVICPTAAVAQDQKASKSKEDEGKPAERVPQASEGVAQDDTESGIFAIERAAKAKRYLFIFFYRNEDDQTQATKEVFDAAMETVADRAMSVAVNTADPVQKEIVDKFGVSRAPMPLILALAPNGAITRSFVRNFNQEQLEMAFVSPCQEKCLKSLQGRKLVLICVQNESTAHNAEAMEGVRQFKADQRYARFTEIVTVDPSDETEVGFLKKLRVDAETEEAITVLLAPPGRPIGTFKGAITKNTLVAAVQKSASGCGPKGCGPKGCGPPKKKPSSGQPGTKKNP